MASNKRFDVPTDFHDSVHSRKLDSTIQQARVRIVKPSD